MATEVTWGMDIGDDETLVFEFPTGVDISTNTYTAEIRTALSTTAAHDAATLKATAVCAIDGQDVTVTVTDTQTKALGAITGNLWWALRETLADGTTDVLFAGRVMLTGTAVQ